jgi:hypothetical protein
VGGLLAAYSVFVAALVMLTKAAAV